MLTLFKNIFWKKSYNVIFTLYQLLFSIFCKKIVKYTAVKAKFVNIVIIYKK